MTPANIKRGTVLRVVSVHHPLLSRDIGKEIVAVEDSNGPLVWASDNIPITYRINRLGNKVVDRDPRSCQILYSVRDLERVPGVAPLW